MAGQGPTFRSLVVAFTDFLTVAIHTALYERDVYPKVSFISARKYNFAVRQSRHPKVCEWINDAVAAVESELLKGSVERVAVVFLSKQNQPLERLVFDVSRLPSVPSSEVDVPLEQTDVDGNKTPILPLVDLEEQLRATMSRLVQCTSTLVPLPKDSTFTVAIELKADGTAPVSHPQPWVPAERQPGQTTKPSNVAELAKPVRAVRAGELVFEAWIEQVQLPEPSQTTASRSTD